VPRTQSHRSRSASLAKARVDAWLIGAFLVLLAGAIAVTVPPASAGPTQTMAGKANDAQNPQRDIIRAAFFTIRAVRPDVSGGKDLLSVDAPEIVVIGDPSLVRRSARLDAVLAPARWFQARAPPHIA